MGILSDEVLMDAYNSAVLFNLEPDFIRLLKEEIVRRDLNPDSYRITA